MLKDTFKSFKASNDCVILAGNACELTVSFEDFAEIIKALSKDLPASMRQDIAVGGWSGSSLLGGLFDFVKQQQPYTSDPGQDH